MPASVTGMHTKTRWRLLVLLTAMGSIIYINLGFESQQCAGTGVGRDFDGTEPLKNSQKSDDSKAPAGDEGHQQTSVRLPKMKQMSFVLIKSEKTGSSTLFSILARFVLLNKLNVMVMTKGGHLDVTKQKGQKPGWDIGPHTDEPADCLIHHARYNRTLLDRWLRSEAKYITLVRDAESWFQSAVRFWEEYIEHKGAEEILQSVPRYFYTPRARVGDQYNGQRALFHLSQLQWLGFDYSQRGDITAIRQYIERITPRFDLKFLTDKFDESLVLMKREFNWDHQDIFYTAKRVGGYRGNRSTLSETTRRQLLSAELNLGDQLLYERFNESWWSQEVVTEPDFIDEVEQFRLSNIRAESECRQAIRSFTPAMIPANRWSAESELTLEYCRLLLADQTNIMHRVAFYAIGRRYDPHT